MASPFRFDWLYHALYPATEPHQSRTVPMEVIAVGISRSGTESLRTALMQLGYTHCYHGWDTILLPRFQHVAWWRLLRRKYQPKPGDPAWSAADFDGLLGHCRAICDLPAAVFADELMQAYPEAKVILNVRKDLDAWHRSFCETLGANSLNWSFWLIHWFNAELFWIYHVAQLGFLGLFFEGDSIKNGKAVYRSHVSRIRQLNLPGDRMLEWSVEDGWKPLCSFLGKDVPDECFPRGNTPKDYEDKLREVMGARFLRACATIVLVVGVPVVVFVAVRITGSPLR